MNRPPLHIGVIMARLRYIDILPVFREAKPVVGEGGLGSYCIVSENCWKFIRAPRRVLGDSFFASMMSCLVILMSDSVFGCGCPKKSFGYLIVIVGSLVQKMLLYCSFSSSLIFLQLGSRFPSSSWRGPIPALIAELFFTNL